MTEHKSFKRLVRARMEKTGESYTAARTQLLACQTTQEGDQPTLATSDDAIRQRAGRGWEEWFDLLDGWGAGERPHREIARWVADELGIEPLAWNAQAITTSYERARGGRAVGEHEDGFAITASKTVAVPVDRLFDAFVDESSQKRWLPDGKLVSAPPPGRSRPASTGRRGDPGARHLPGEGRGKEHRRRVARAPRRRPRGRTDEGLLARARRRASGGARGLSAYGDRRRGTEIG